MPDLFEYVKSVKKGRKFSQHFKSWGGETRFFCRLTFGRPGPSQVSRPAGVKFHGPDKADKEVFSRKLQTEKIPHQLRKQGMSGFYLYMNDVSMIKWAVEDPVYSHYLTEIAVSAPQYMTAFASKPIEAFDIEFIDDPNGAIYHGVGAKAMNFRLVLKPNFQAKLVDQVKTLGTLIDEQKENYQPGNRQSLNVMLKQGFVINNSFFYAVDINHVLMAKMVTPDLITKIIKLETLNNAQKSSNDSSRERRYKSRD